MKILSVFTHPQFVPNLYVFICSAEHKGRYLEECFNQTYLKYLPLCSAEQINTLRFGTTWGWV